MTELDNHPIGGKKLADHRKSVEALQDDIVRVSDVYAARFSIPRDEVWHVAKLSEELGEVMQAYLRVTSRARIASGEDNHSLKESLEDEVADLFGQILLFSQQMQIDLPSALDRKWFRHLG